MLRTPRQAPVEPGFGQPVIGLCAAIERAQWGVWDTPAHLLPREYADAVQRAGAIPIILPPTGAIEGVLGIVDGLIFAGGADLDPALYGARPHPATTGVTPERDAFELALLQRAIDRDLSVLAICRGMQLLNVARGGTLTQHLPDVVGHDEHRRVAGSFDGADHTVRLVEGSQVAEAAGELLHRTLSHHHQAVDRVGAGLAVTGTSTLDGVVEAIELPDASCVVGVQWHPEVDETSRLIDALVRRARTRRAPGAST